MDGDWTIRKYELEVTNEQEIFLPKTATILDIQLQNGKICLWALFNPLHVHGSRSIYIFGAGKDVPRDLIVDVARRSTVQIDQHTWHVFVGW